MDSLPKWLTVAMFLVASLAAAGAHAVAPTQCKPGSPGTATRLVVLLHGYTQSPDGLQKVRDTVCGAFEDGDTDVLAPQMPFGLLSIETPSSVVADLLYQIDEAWSRRTSSGRPYDKVVLIGHSIGSLYARKAYVAACGENPEAPFEPGLKARLKELGGQPLDSPRPWAGAVDRIVLLAGLNRGWSISHHMSLMRSINMSLGAFAGRVLEAVSGRQFIILEARRGAPFITQLRLQWLAMRDYARPEKHKGVGGATVVQLLGTADDLVPPTDHVDPVTGRDFVYLEVPRTGHLNVVEMDATEAGKERANALKSALAQRDLRTVAVHAPISERGTVLTEDRKVKDVVFVVHGIRDTGYWTFRIANRVVAKGRDQGRVIESETSSYGYFPMLSFLRPGARQEKVEWLMDQYTKAKALYPEADFSFVGHSNGTYLLAKALTDYPAVKFKNVAFAGSVVDRDFKWSDYTPDRVQAVFNFVATADWVVAWFPKALQQMQIQDLGSAGHDGFAQARPAGLVQELESEGVVGSRSYVIGGHGAAIEEEWWDSIAAFVLSGKFEPPSNAEVAREQVSWIKWLGEVAPLLWVLIAGILAAILRAVLRLRIREWQKTLLVVVYAAIVWLVVTEV